MYHYDNGNIYDCSKCRHIAKVPGCIFHADYHPSKDNYPCDENGNRIKRRGKRKFDWNRKLTRRELSRVLLSLALFFCGFVVMQALFYPKEIPTALVIAWGCVYLVSIMLFIFKLAEK